MDNANDQCGFDGNGDLYGLGVRLGIYLQWSTSVLADNLHEPAIETTREANMTFQLAMLAGLILITVRSDMETKTIEGYIALLFCFASAWIASLQGYSAAKARYTGAEDRSGGLSIAGDVRGQGGLLLSTATCAYGLWFLFVGLDKLPRTACPETIFFFAPVKAFGWYRSLAKAVFIASLIGSAVLIPAHTILLLRNMGESVARWGNPGNPSPRPTEIVRTIHLHIPRFIGSLVAIAVFIIAVELTLVWNHIRGVHTCDSFSQLFPLMVGATNFTRLCYQLFKSLLLGDARIEWKK
ncbi:hypothetical protein C7999DRAFT_17022 [Corynascus novoguineensis]|uniref:Uncharacterized protein n=1 Tax=Corynascus novoguineensis TaxID=1126955 RepID=A0AAN7CN72_9PEZI|nr:hypothetical protein C7999DRAFT_17022 [Corynascus novoguineensis]